MEEVFHWAAGNQQRVRDLVVNEPTPGWPRFTNALRLSPSKQFMKANMTLNVRPVGDRILVEPVEEKQNGANKSRIIIPDTAKEKSMECLVVALGSGRTDEDGKKVPFEMKKGDRVLMSKYGGTEIKLDGKDYKVVTSDDILAIIS
jgi:chaperonin GroES